MTHSPEDNNSYLVVTPARNEESYIDHTLRSIIRQTQLPTLWLIADDGSSDRTADIVSSYARNHPFIRLINVPAANYDPYDRRVSYGAVIRAFNYALGSVSWGDCTFIVKLDADLSFDKDYFARLFKEFSIEPRLGIAGGHCFERKNGTLKKEWVPDFHVRGATKIYRRECFSDIGGIEELLGWDAIDELRAQMKGWITRSFDEPGVIHHRGSGSRGSVIRGRLRGGRANYFVGYHPVFMMARGFRRMFYPPYVAGGAALLWGYFSCYLRREQQFRDEQVRAYLRRQQISRLLGSLSRLVSKGKAFP